MDERRLTLMAVHAHPDDEVITTGGVLARAASEGKRTVLVCATRGEVGQIVDPELDRPDVRERLGEVREEELRRACEILGVQDLYFLDYHDSGMAGTPENEDPRAFANADPKEAAGRLVAIMRRTRPDVVITYDAKGGYGHPDHIATHRATIDAFHAAGDPEQYPEAGAPWRPRKLYYVGWPRSEMRRMRQVMEEAGREAWFDEEFIENFGVPDEDITAVVDVRACVPKLIEALRAHRTQITSDWFLTDIPGYTVDQTMGTEMFTRVVPPHQSGEREDDVFAGLT